jgi:hypothetical protein
MTDLKVVSFKKEEEEEVNVHIKITYEDWAVEKLKADSFGSSQEMPEFTVFWKEEPYQLIMFIHNRFIRKVEILEDE